MSVEGSAPVAIDAIMRQLLLDGPLSLEELRLRVRSYKLPKKQADQAMHRLKLVRRWDMIEARRFVVVSLPDQSVPTTAALAAGAFRAEFSPEPAGGVELNRDEFLVRLPRTHACSRCGIPLPQGRLVIGRTLLDSTGTGGATAYQHVGNCPQRPTRVLQNARPTPLTQNASVWPGLLALLLAVVVGWGLLSQLTFGEWQLIDWGVVVGSFVLAFHFLSGRGRAPAWLPFGAGATVLAGTTVGRWDQAVWFVVDLIVIGAMLAIAAITVIPSPNRQQESSAP
jgi:hypothetical protein